MNLLFEILRNSAYTQDWGKNNKKTVPKQIFLLFFMLSMKIMEKIIWTWVSLSLRLLRLFYFFSSFLFFFSHFVQLQFPVKLILQLIDLNVSGYVICVFCGLINFHFLYILLCVWVCFVCVCVSLYICLIAISWIRSTASFSWQTTRPWSGTPGWSWSVEKKMENWREKEKKIHKNETKIKYLILW